MYKFRWLAIFAACLSTMAPVSAGQVVVSGQVTHEGIQRLNSISWHHSLAQAQSDALRQNKMIFWLHILGQVDGAT